MKHTTRKAAALALLVLVCLCLAWGGALPDPLCLFGPSADPARESFRPIVSEAEDDREAVLLGGGAGTARPSTTEGDSSDLLPTVAEATATGFIDAVLVDASGRTLAGAELREVTERGYGRVSSSAPDGYVRLSIDVGEAERRIQVEAKKRGYASRAVDVPLAAGRTARLGRIELLPGGAISGRVVDENGHGIADALVTQVEGSLSASDLKRGRYNPMSRAKQRASVPRTHSSPGGEFALAGLEANSCRLWVEAEGRLPTWTDPVEVRAGQETYGVEIVLPRISAKDHIHGVVLDPSGEPVPHALLRFTHRSKSGGLSISGLEERAGEEGTFDFLLFEDARLWITASDPNGRYGPASALDLPTGRGVLILRLTTPATVTLRVLGGAGRPVERYAFTVLSADERLVHQDNEAEDRPGGVAALRVPAAAFLIRITAGLHEVQLAGPYQPDAVGDAIEVRLRAIQGLAGRVLAGGEPVAGARVRLHRSTHDDERIEMNGFRCKLDPIEADETTTDEEGRFVLTAHVADDYFVSAAMKGFARAEVGPLALGPDVSATPVEVQLGHGGVIEGHVLTVDGDTPDGILVVARRGDGHPQTVRVGPDGAFRFEGLLPGPWIIERAESEVVPGRRTVTISRVSRATLRRKTKWSCEVHDGRTTVYDLRPVSEEVWTLRGTLHIEGQRPTNFTALLLPADATLMDALGPGRAIDPSGHFELQAPEEGPYLLALRGRKDEREHQFLLAEVDLTQQVTPWAIDLSSGTLVVEGVAAPADEDGVPSLAYLWEGPGRLLYLGALNPDADGIARLEAVPAGTGRLVRPVLEIADPRLWEVAREVTVSRGKATRVVAP